jgi:hypothetical protein
MDDKRSDKGIQRAAANTPVQERIVRRRYFPGEPDLAGFRSRRHDVTSSIGADDTASTDEPVTAGTPVWVSGRELERDLWKKMHHPSRNAKSS